MSDSVTNDNDFLLLTDENKTSESSNRLGSSNKATPPTPSNNTQMGDPIRINEILKYINLNRSLHLLKSDKYLTILE